MKFNIIIFSALLWLQSFATAQVVQEAPQEVDLKTLKHPVTPFLWKIEKEGVEKPSYLFGTMHVSDPRIATLHPAAEKAYQSADKVYTEVDLSLAGQFKSLAQMRRKDKSTLKKSVGDELFKKVDEEMKLISPQLSAQAFNGMKTWVLAVTLPILGEQLKGEEALDVQLWNRAKKDNKETGTLETVQEQLGQFDKLTEEEQVTMLADTVKMMKVMRKEDIDPLTELLNGYLKADVDGINKFFDPAEMQTEMPKELIVKFLKLILDNRNVHMTKKIDKSMTDESDKIHFFAAGVAHYIGQENVIEILKEKGYKVTWVKE